MQEKMAHVFHWIIKSFKDEQPHQTRVLDFGCGSGELVRLLSQIGYDAYGTDIGGDWIDEPGAWRRNIPATSWVDGRRFRPLIGRPYRIPYDTGFFDVVVSNQVIEHAENKTEAFAEITRVLKQNGISIHCFPSKWRLIEPHIFVPLVSWFWPNVPYWWLCLWALLGVRNPQQRSMSWREVAIKNHHYCKIGISYWSKRKIKKALGAGFHDFAAARLRAGGGRATKLSRVPILGLAFGAAYGSLHMLWVGTAPQRHN